MTEEELEQWRDEFEAFHARFADLFERSESREQARKYLRGLLDFGAAQEELAGG
jgi:hypothetical protein